MSASRLPKAVLFDLDGTLVDSAPDLVQAVNRVLADHGRAPVPLAELRAAVSKGGRAMLAVSFPELTPDQREPLLTPFLEYYAQALAVHSVLFDGIADVLASLEARGIRWGIVTNKPLHLAEAVIASFGWQTRSAVLLGGDSLPKRKPDPDQLLKACVDLGLNPGECIYIGDDERDAVAAKAAGMKAVVALWGYRGVDEDPRHWGGDVMVERAADLLRDGVLVLP